MKQSMKALLVAGVLGVSATACMTHADFNGVIYDTAAGTITITHGSETITMADKNIGATEVGYGASASTASYGNYYQWGGTTSYASTLTPEEAKAQGFNRDWTSEGWTKATDPCPSGYHVPTSGEWNTVLSMYTAEGNDIVTFNEAFKIPFAGHRNFSDAWVYGAGDDAYLWSASPRNDEVCYLDDNGSNFYVYYRGHSDALPVRCFANNPTNPAPYNTSTNPTSTTEITLTIEEGQLSIGTDGDSSVTLSGSMAASLESKTVEKSLEKLFRVEDLKGSSKGYRTTISVTDMTGSVENVVYTIPAENIYIKTTELEIESGTGDDVVLTESLREFRSMKEPVTFIQRGTGTTAGLLGKYGARPELKVVVPANMPGTTYKGTITYTLYENEW